MATIEQRWLDDQVHVTEIRPIQGEELVVDGKLIKDGSNQILFIIGAYRRSKFLSEEVRLDAKGFRIVRRIRKYHPDFDQEGVIA